MLVADVKCVVFTALRFETICTLRSKIGKSRCEFFELPYFASDTIKKMSQAKVKTRIFVTGGARCIEGSIRYRILMGSVDLINLRQGLEAMARWMKTVGPRRGKLNMEIELWEGLPPFWRKELEHP